MTGDELSCEDCELGMRVLLTNPCHRYSIGPGNPATGTEWECEGEIIHVGATTTEVQWGNNNTNTYHNRELTLTGLCRGRCKSIWENLQL